MDVRELLLLVGAAVLGGGLNAVAGGGSFFTFPALVFTGIPAIPANATSALALWPGSLASAAAYRHDLGGERRRLTVFAVASLAGGVAGALLLVKTPEAAFDIVVPFLLLLATVLFALGPRITRRLRARAEADHRISEPAGAFIQFAISVYGGYFGGGMGMMMLAAYALMGMEDIHRMNGLKSALAVAINGIALCAFMVAGIIAWRQGLVMTVGAVAGGYGGAALARRIDPKWVRAFITVVGLVLSAVFFHRAFWS